MKSIYLLLLIFKYGNVVSVHFEMIVPDHKNVFDLNLYESVLDEELCEEQINYMIQQNDTELLLEFLDAGIRTPRGVLTGNILDLGNYHQCLAIHQPITNSVVEGKYCMISVPLDQDWPSLPSIPTWPDDWPNITWPGQQSMKFRMKKNVLQRSRDYQMATAGYRAFFGAAIQIESSTGDTPLPAVSLRLGTCIPKPCTPRAALKALFNISENTAIEVKEDFCRLPNDKQWVAGEYVAFSIFGVLIVLVVLSSAYDIRCTIYQQKDPKQINKLLIAFSAYTNTRRLVTYTPVPGALECLDGIRAIAMMWVIVGHTFATLILSETMANLADAFVWMTSLKSLWITAAPITVDTFFMLSGLLLVYTTAGKVTSLKLIKNLHLFYLNRLLRMFPVLAAVILLQISIYSRMTDGPYWEVAAAHTHRCRLYWWSTLLHIQNFVHPSNMTSSFTSYHLSWVLTGKRRLAWSALVGAMIAVLAASTTYNFIKKFPSGSVSPSRPLDTDYYLKYYYMNPLTRASPFFVGLIFGYILHLNRGKKVSLYIVLTSLLWICTAAVAILIIYSPYPIMQMDWKNQFADSMINSFMRPAWAMVVGWIIFACVHGYAGPINWILCLRIETKLLGGFSCKFYIINLIAFQFLADFSLAVIVAYLLTIIVDAPCSVLIKHFMGAGPKETPPKDL